MFSFLKKFLREQKLSNEYLGWSILGLVFVLFVLIISLLFFTLAYASDIYWTDLNPDSAKDIFSKSGAAGNLLSSLLMPFISALAVVTTFFAFIVQYRANQSQIKGLKTQQEALENQKEEEKEKRRISEIERFETKFYELLRLHKSNVNEIDIDQKYFGRKAIVKMYEEFRFIIQYIEHQWSIREEKKRKLINDKLTSLAYTLFFLGVPRRPIRADEVPPHNIDSNFVAECIRGLRELREDYFFDKNSRKSRPVKIEFENSEPLYVDYFPFDGHSAKLGHYYRHLYQLIKFVVTETSLFPEKKARYEYIKTVRAQLSNHEQTLIYYNSFFSVGNIWWEDRTIRKDRGNYISYFLDWKIIKNIPYDLSKFGTKPEEIFKRKLKKLRGVDKQKMNKKLLGLFEYKEIDKIIGKE